MSFGQRISELRKKAGFSQEALAEKLGVSRQAIGKWESGVSLPSMENLKELAMCLGVSVDTLLGDKEDISDAKMAGEDTDGKIELESIKVFLEEQENVRAQKKSQARKWHLLTAAAAGIFVVVLVSVGAYSLVRLNKLEQAVEALKAEMMDAQVTEHYYYADKSGTEAEVDSILSDKGYTFGEYHKESDTAEITVSAMLKNYREGMQVFFSLQPTTDKKNTLAEPILVEARQNEDGSCTATLEVPMVEQFNIGIQVKEGEDTETEIIDYVYAFASLYRPVITLDPMEFNFTWDAKKLRIQNGEIYVSVEPSHLAGAPRSKTITARLYLQDEEIFTYSEDLSDMYRSEDGTEVEDLYEIGEWASWFGEKQLTGKSFDLPASSQPEAEKETAPSVRWEIQVEDEAGNVTTDSWEW